MFYTSQEYVVTSENNMSRSLMYLTKMFLDDNMKDGMDVKHLKTWIVVSGFRVQEGSVCQGSIIVYQSMS